MKRTLIIAFISFTTILSFSQKAELKIIKTKNASISEWQILDEKYLPVLSDSEYSPEDSVIFSLEANKRYFIKISVSEILQSDTCLYALLINGESILRINSDAGFGDKFYPFFTGVQDDPSAKITGGSDADISEFPWQVYLEAGDYVCGGSIIDETWILTAAHCTKGEYNVSIPASEMAVTVGANNPRNTSQGKKYLVSEVIVHERYDLQTLNNDIALLKLTEPIDYPNALPLKLVSEKDALDGATDPGVMAWITGYGATRVNPASFPSNLQKVNIPIVSNEQASVVWKEIPETDMMAGYLNRNMDACIGDSGGPLVVPVQGKNKLAGIVSWGSSNCNTYGAYTRLSLFESWITNKTGIEITFRAPVPNGDTIVCPGTSVSEYNVSSVTGATAYNWLLAPDDAGSITGNNENAVVLWNPGFRGTASINLQVLRNDELSEKSELAVNIARQTRILSSPEDTVLCAELPITLKVDAEGYNLIHTWYKNGNFFNSGPGSEVIISSALSGDSGNYFCEIEGSCGKAVSETSSLTILPVTRINNITPDTEVPLGGDLTLEVHSEGHDLSYQWYKDDARLNFGTSYGLVIQNVDANDIGLYKVTVSGTCGTETSSNIYVFVRKEGSSEDYETYVWPTVVNDEFSIATDNDQYYNYTLLDNTGKLIRQVRNCRYETRVEIGDLPAGLYIITMYNNKFRKSVKLIKK